MLLETVGAGLKPAQTWTTTRVRPYLTHFYCTQLSSLWMRQIVNAI